MRSLSRFLAALLSAAVMLPVFGGIRVLADGEGIPIDEEHFEDDTFRGLIEDVYDYDGNGYISDYEISITMNISCEHMGITSLKGIEYYTDLQGLWCRDNDIEELDLSGNPDLRGLWCSENPISELDFSNNPELVWVYCFECNLTSLDFSDTPHMAYIECNTNPLTELDISTNSELEHLMCGSCELHELDLSNNPELCELVCFRNEMTYLNIEENYKLKRLNIWDNPDLGNIDVDHLSGLEYFNCAHNGMTEIDVSGNPQLMQLSCAYNDIEELDLSNNPRLGYLDCADNQIGELDLSHNPQLYFLQAFINDFETVNIGNNSRLLKTYNDGYYQDEPNVAGKSWTIDYGGSVEPMNELKYFLCVGEDVSILTRNDGYGDVYDSYIDTNDGLSSSDDLITREMAIQTLYELAGSPYVSGSSEYTDVESGSWYEDAVIWGRDNNICFGYPNICSDTFGVGECITREDLALMIHRFAEYQGYKTAFDYGRTDWYADFVDIDFYAWGAFTFCIQWEILLPDGDDSMSQSQRNLKPHGRVTRDDLEEGIITLMELNWDTPPSVIPVPAGPGTPAGKWMKDSGGWWYKNPDGSYPSSCWKKISNKWYYFNSNGYIATGWKKVGSSWYYLGTDGAMQTGWKQISGKWYYFNGSGAMVTGWKQISGKWYYFKSGGDMATGWVKVENYWYYMSSSGEMQTGWKQISGKWYYFYSSGKMACNTTIGSYTLDANGVLVS